MQTAPTPDPEETALAVIHRIARWRHRLSMPLGQVLSLIELVREVARHGPALAVLEPLQVVRDSALRITDELNKLLDQKSNQALEERAEIVAGLVRMELDRMEALAGQGESLLVDDTAVALRADIGSLREGLSRMRRALDSLNTPAAFATTGPRLVVQNEKTGATLAPFGSGLEHDGSKLLLVDDDRLNLKVIGRRLERMGFVVISADRGEAGLKILEQTEVGLGMLDIMMPELDGFETLERIRANPRWRDLPVIMLTALDDAESTARCLASGAADYVSKPFDETVLRARIRVALDRKKLRDKERRLMERVRSEKHVSENLLHSILPQAIANRLREGEEQLVDRFAEASVVFVDIVGFTLFSATHDPEQTVALLNDLFSRFDRLVDQHGMEKIKTIGDAYLAVAGVPEAVDDHAARAARLALSVHGAMAEFNQKHSIKWSVRVGVDSGPLVAGIIGSRKFAYDLWGDTVNVASRLESHARPDQTLISGSTAAALGSDFIMEPLPEMELHNRGWVEVHALRGLRA